MNEGDYLKDGGSYGEHTSEHDDAEELDDDAAEAKAEELREIEREIEWKCGEPRSIELYLGEP